MSNTNSVVAVLKSHDQAEKAIRQLQKDGFDMKKLSIVGKDYHTEEHVVGYYSTGDRMLYWGELGAFWGGFWGLLLGSAFFWVPGIGQLVVAGPLVMWIVGALEEAALVGGLSALGAGLQGCAHRPQHHRDPAQLVQDLRQLRAHARALARSEDQDDGCTHCRDAIRHAPSWGAGIRTPILRTKT